MIETRKVFIKNGDIVLEGLIDAPPGETRSGVVLCHPHPLYGGEMTNALIAKTAKVLAERGFTALRFNFRGVGGSGGVHDGGSGEIGDALCALDFLASLPGMEKLHLLGYSFGSVVGLKAAGNDPRVEKLVGFAPPVTSMEMGTAGFSAKSKFFVWGTLDEHALPADRDKWYGALPEPKKMALFQGCDHFFGGFVRAAAEEAAQFLET